MAVTAARGALAVQLRGGGGRRAAPRAAAPAASPTWSVLVICSQRSYFPDHPIMTDLRLPVVEIETPGSAPRLVATVAEMVVPVGADFCIPCVATDHPPPHYTYTELPRQIYISVNSVFRCDYSERAPQVVPRERGSAGGGARRARRVAVGGGRGSVLRPRDAGQGGRVAVQGIQCAGRRHGAHTPRRRRPLRRHPRAESRSSSTIFYSFPFFPPPRSINDKYIYTRKRQVQK